MIVMVVGALLPVVFVLGYAAGRFHVFPEDGAAAITELVLDFAPAGEPAPLFGLFCAVVAVVWAGAFAVARLGRRRGAASASLHVLLTSRSTM